MTLQAHQLACQRGERLLFEGLDFSVEAGQALRVVGHNGSGKTSLLRLLCGLGVPAAGAVTWHDDDVRDLRESFGAQLIYLGHANGVKDDLAAWENVVAGAALSGHPVSTQAALDALDALGLGQAAWLPTRCLSQGQRKRV
ncbi:MAG: ATP-binding cassette domain-containing protein, partial [Pseudomonadota bacterium]